MTLKSKGAFFLAVISFTFSFYAIQAQCPVAQFSLPVVACGGDTITATNQSAGTGPLSFQWDFCLGDLSNTPAHTPLTPAFSGLDRIKIIREGNNYYGFVMDLLNGLLTVMDFNGDLNNPSPTVTSNGLGLSFPNSLSLIKIGSTWYGITTEFFSPNTYLLTFSNGLTGPPVLTAINTSGAFSGGGIKGLKLLKHNGEYYLFAVSFNTDQLFCFNFGTSITNSAPTLNYTITIPGSIPGTTSTSDIDMQYDCTNWTGFITARGSANMIRADFPVNLNQTPTFTTINLVGTANLAGLTMLREGNERYVFYCNQDLTNGINQAFRRLSFGNSYQNTPADSSFGNANFSDIRSIASIYDSSFYKVFVTSFGTQTITRYDFPNACGSAAASYSEVTNPDLFYANSGMQNIGLTATDTSGLSAIYVDSIFINDKPQANFSYTDNCVGSMDSLHFTDISTVTGGSITQWNWSFGDVTSSTLQNPYHHYSALGQYNVTLTVQSGAGCIDSITLPVDVFEKPVPDFSFTTGCAGSSVQFTDLTTLVSDTIAQWQWYFGDGDSSNIQNPAHIYSQGGTFNVVLVIQSGHGCIDSIIKVVTIEFKPVVDFNVTHTCIGDTVQFSNSTNIPGGFTLTYNWKFGDNGTSTLTNPSHPYLVGGNYNVTLIATGSNTCIDSIIKPITIATPSVPNFTFPAQICENNAVQFTDASSGSVTSWFWDFGDTDTSSQQNPLHVYSSSGTFNVTLTATVATACDASITLPVTITASPDANFSVPDVCFGQPSQFTDLSTFPSGTPISQWHWDFGDPNSIGDSSDLQNPAYTYSGPGIFPVFLTVTSSIGCIDTITINAAVYAIPQVGFKLGSLACSGSLISFLDTSLVNGDSISNWFWDFGDGATDTVKDPFHTFTSGGTKNVTLTVTSSHGCSATIIKQIVVKQSPQFSFTSSLGCLGDSTLFVYIPQAGTNAFSWAWNFGDNGQSFITNPHHLYTSASTYTVVLQVTDSAGCNGSYSQQVIVHPKPIPDFTDSTSCSEEIIQFHNTSTISSGSIVSYHWDFGNGDTSDQVNPVYAYVVPGNYFITLTAVSDFGCIDSVKKSFIVKSKPVALFDFFPPFTSPGVPVNFNNLSQNATSYLWNFGDSFASNQVSPTHTFADTGIYSVTLIALNSNGCSDTVKKIISVLIPYLDLGIKEIHTFVLGDLMQIDASLSNYGNVPATSYELACRIENGSLINELTEDTIEPGETKNYKFNARYTINRLNLPSYFCVDIIHVNTVDDENDANDHLCNAISGELEVLEIFPNPVNDNFSIQFVTPLSDKISADLFDISGQLVDHLYEGISNKGYNRIDFTSRSISKGVYFIRFMYRDEIFIRKFLKG